MGDLQNFNKKQFIKNSANISSIKDWISINEKYIIVLKELVGILSVVNPAYLYIKEKFNKNLNLWTQHEMDKIRKLIDKSIDWQQKTVKEQRKHLCFAEKVHNSANRNVSYDKNGHIFISPRNLEKLLRIIDIDREYNHDFIYGNGDNILTSIKEFNDDIIAEFDSIYDNACKRNLC